MKNESEKKKNENKKYKSFLTTVKKYFNMFSAKRSVHLWTVYLKTKTRYKQITEYIPI